MTPRNARRIAERVQAEHSAPSGPVPNAAKAELARIVRSIPLPVSPDGGCWWRATCGKLLLSMVGIESELIMGAMAYRGHPDFTPLIYGPNGKASRNPISGIADAHFFLAAGRELIDFSCGDWPPLLPAGSIIPPDYIWAPRALFTR